MAKCAMERLIMNKELWKDKNVLITGCTGFLGSWITQALAQEANVIGLVRDIVPKSRLTRENIVNKITVVNGTVIDYNTIGRIINEYEIEVVFHIAAQTIVEIANRLPVNTFETNIGGTWNVLEACRRNETVKQIILASSDKAYGSADKLPYDETTPLKGEYPYDVSKVCADFLGNSYFKTYNLPVCITRCGNFYGGGDLNFNRLIPGPIRSLIRNKDPIIRSDGQYIRDYLYIEDATNAYIALAEKMIVDKSILGETFNFSSENPMKAIDIVNKILIKSKTNHLKPRILGHATNEIPSQYLSSEKANRLLGWKAKFSFDAGIEKTIEWYRNFFS